MAATMKAFGKVRAARGLQMDTVAVPLIWPTDVLVRVKTASICGTDLHIYGWDRWSQGRIKPPVTLGHEFCGTVERTGDEVRAVMAGDFVSAEMNVNCGHCHQCRLGQPHICQNLRIIAIDQDGAFAEFGEIPAPNIWRLPAAIQQGFKALRAGGRASLLGIPTESVPLDLVNDVIFKGATVQGIYGRRMYETWVQMTSLLKAGRLNLDPLFGERASLDKFEGAFALLQGGLAGKILLYPDGVK